MNKKFRVTFNAPVTLGFVFMCLFVTALGVVTSGKSSNLLFVTYRSSLLNPLMYLRLFTHILGHDGWNHFIGNAAYLLLLGPLLEEKYGSKVMAVVIVITAFVTGMANNLLFNNIALCGASGIVFAFIVLASFTNFNEGEIPLSFILVAVIYIGGQIYDGIAMKDNISNMTHIIGGIVGATAGYKIAKSNN